MKIFMIQETDWIKKGPHQQHHLFERLSVNNDVIIMDYDIWWRKTIYNRIFKKKMIYNQTKGKVIDNVNITIIRPPILKAPWLDYFSIILFYPYYILKVIVEQKPDVVIGFGLLNTNFAVVICKIFNIPFIYYLIDSLHTIVPSPKLVLISKIIEKINIKLSDKIIVINDKLKDYVITMGGMLSKISIVSAGVDAVFFNHKHSSKEIRDLYGIKDDALVLFFMGRLYSFSGIREVAKNLITNYNDKKILLMLLGRGDLWQELSKIKQEYDYNNQLLLIEFVPYVEVPKYLAAADICLLPAYNNEIMRNIVPIKIYEYLAMAKPVISTKLPGIFSEFGNNGILYVDGPDDVMDLVIKLVRKKKYIKKIGLEGKSFVESYNWDHLVYKFLSILNEAVKKNLNIRIDP